jgi:hypothetical protein
MGTFYRSSFIRELYFIPKLLLSFFDHLCIKNLELFNTYYKVLAVCPRVAAKQKENIGLKDINNTFTICLLVYVECHRCLFE